MSKLPNHSLWARATASSSGRVTLLAKHHPLSTSSSASSSALTTSSSSSRRHRDSFSSLDAIAEATTLGGHPPSVSVEHLASIGAVSAPFYGPQTAEVTEALESAAAAAVAANFSLPRYDTAPTTFSSSSSMLPLSSSSLLRNMQTPQLIAPRPHRAALHLWSQAHQNSSAAVAAAAAAAAAAANATKALTDAAETSAARTSSKVERRRREKGKMKAPDSSLPSSSDREKLEELFVSLMMGAMQQSGTSAGTGAGSAGGAEAGSGWAPAKDYFPTSSSAAEDVLFAPSSSTTTASSSSSSSSPSNGSPSPSPSPFDTNFTSNAQGPDITLPRSGGNKLATTTSSEVGLSNSLSSSNGADGPSLVHQASSSSSGSSSSSSNGANLASSTAGMGSSSHGHQAGQPGLPSQHWARSFELPRSSKRHDFTFEHGAYGIPKRHPLSSIRNGKNPSASQGAKSTGEGRETPGHEEVATSKVKAATNMLYAAADFLAGPQTPSADGKGSRIHRPMSGEDALSMALSGGSTAEGSEVLSYHAYGARRSASGKTKQSPPTGSPSKMAIRDSDGRIIKDRLRSVQVGEDAYFLRPDSLGVADGVGGWASRPGADPALFSRLLMHFCAVELSRYDGLSAAELAADNGSLLHAWGSVDPVEVMHRAWERCVRASRREGILGSSTALIALLRGDELRIANVGDCVLLIIRQGDLLFRSTEQQHSFNFPVQLGMMGDTTQSVKKRTEAANKARGAAQEKGRDSSSVMEDYDDVEDEPGSSSSSSIDGGAAAGVKGHAAAEGEAEGAGAVGGGAGPTTEAKEESDEQEPEWDEPRRDAGRWTVRVEAGDIIVVGSDGLMDNLFDEDIIEEVLRFLPQQQQGDGLQDSTVSPAESAFSPQLVSEALCSRAKAVSEDGRAISSPFQQRAMEEGLHYVGGKHDDISVLVCLVGEREEGGGLTTGATTPVIGAREGDGVAERQGQQGSKATSSDTGEKKLGLTSHASRTTSAAFVSASL
ncbi:protein serine/threonine phosphatase 2C [Acaromyces ingoldii]|uniref:Protein serine/threonine phosphatase 2C n=1 Tax=Acaromyces ingoldii TaxID=215250 RepID=A0A316YKR3_9BASI|nr:protein serine/threonine phosphatase 2C [Acaromyces ingoldii]PWN88305.1 protein serine/threonine phosphatase 2C [Acaromyces ingoldii]